MRKLRLTTDLDVAVDDVEKLVASCDCGARWTGTKPSHCMVCHQTFGSDTAGDQHRYGPYDPPGRRRCRTPAWMTGKGWWLDDAGIWRLPRPVKNPFSGKDTPDGSQD